MGRAIVIPLVDIGRIPMGRERIDFIGEIPFPVNLFPKESGVIIAFEILFALQRGLKNRHFALFRLVRAIQ